MQKNSTCSLGTFSGNFLYTNYIILMRCYQWAAWQAALCFTHLSLNLRRILGTPDTTVDKICTTAVFRHCLCRSMGHFPWSEGDTIHTSCKPQDHIGWECPQPLCAGAAMAGKQRTEILELVAGHQRRPTPEKRKRNSLEGSPWVPGIPMSGKTLWCPQKSPTMGLSPGSQSETHYGYVYSERHHWVLWTFSQNLQKEFKIRSAT